MKIEKEIQRYLDNLTPFQTRRVVEILLHGEQGRIYILKEIALFNEQYPKMEVKR